MKSLDLIIKVIEHNNWANQNIIKFCSELTDENLDATPLPNSEWSIRDTLTNMVESQSRYLLLLTLEPKQREEIVLDFSVLEENIVKSGKKLLLILSSEAKPCFETKLQNRSQEYLVEFWVVVLQIISHAAKRREQVNRMLQILGIRPPILDSWSYGRSTNAVIQTQQSHFQGLMYPGT